jgi:PAS domain S-box-containing protein
MCCGAKWSLSTNNRIIDLMGTKGINPSASKSPSQIISGVVTFFILIGFFPLSIGLHLAIREKAWWEASIYLVAFLVFAGIIVYSVSVFHRKLQTLFARNQKDLNFVSKLLDTIPSPVFYKDSQGRYLGCNQAFLELFDTRFEDIKGKSVFDIAPEEIAQKYHIKDEELLNHGGVQVYEWKVKKKSGEIRDVVFHKARFLDHKGEVAGLIGIIIDVSEMSALANEKAQAEELALASAKMASIGEIASAVAHEIRNPLAAISFSAESLDITLKDSEKEKISRPLDIIHRSVDRISTIIDGLRVYARSGGEQNEAFSVYKAAENTIAIIKAIYNKRGIQLIENYQANNDEVFGNYSKFQQVLMNLLSNASDAVEDAGIKQIELTTANDTDNSIVVIIRDSGSGIPQDVASKIFESGFTTKAIGKGTGLGLGIVKSYVEDMGGQIQVDSKVGEGTSFRISLPLYSQQKNIANG